MELQICVDLMSTSNQPVKVYLLTTVLTCFDALKKDDSLAALLMSSKKEGNRQHQ